MYQNTLGEHVKRYQRQIRMDDYIITDTPSVFKCNSGFVQESEGNAIWSATLTSGC